MKKILYQSFSLGYNEMLSEEDSLKYFDRVNETKYFKLYEEKKLSLQEILRRIHDEKRYYDITIIENNIVYCYIEITPENDYVGVHFLDEKQRNYLTYSFKEIEPAKKLFLKEVWYYNFPNEETADEDYRIHFVFNQDGDASYRKYDEINRKAIDYETKKTLDVSGLYEDYPEFGQYNNLIRIERDMELLDNIGEIH